jgi:uncharacterized protein YvpB
MLNLIKIKHVKIILAVVILITSASSSMSALFLYKTTAPAAKLQYSNVDQPIDKPLVIKLNRKIIAVDLTKITVSPEINGEWRIKHGDLVDGDQLLFVPSQDFQINTEYKVSQIDVRSLIFGTEKLPEIVITIEPALGLKNDGLIAISDDTIIAADSTFSLSSRHPMDLEIKTNPEVSFIRKTISDTEYSWQSDKLLPQDQKLVIDIYDAKNNAVIASKSLIVAAQPKITFNKPTYFNRGDSALLVFSDEIVSPQSDSITFDIDGVGAWKSAKEYDFVPTKVDPGMNYGYKIKSGLRTKDGGILAEDYIGSFSTTGAVTVSDSGPGGYELSQSSELINFTFDQAVDKASVEQRFSISAGNITNTYWTDNTFFAKLTDLGFQRTITATIASGVKNTGFGLPSDKAFKVSFTTEAHVVKYDVPHYRQQHISSCAAASLRMILAFRGVNVSDMDIVLRMGYDPHPINNSTNPSTWDDPSLMFVGGIDSATAAGPDAPPVAKAAQSYGRGASFVNGASVNWMADQLSSGHLIVMFGAAPGSNNFVTWQTPSGGTARMNTTSHARTVIGFKGEPSNLIGFWINDPATSGTQFWTASQLQANINLDAYQQAVSVE